MSDTEVRLISKYAPIIMVLATILPPYYTGLEGFAGQPGESIRMIVYALLWAIYPPSSRHNGLEIFTYSSLSTGLSIGFINIIFALQVIRYIRGDASRKSTLVAGALTLVLPIVSLLVAWPLMVVSGTFAYIGPIPIQLITGLLLMRFAGPKEITASW